eukprot:scaffold26379_cov52-Attheya_sp.AAC.1
MSDHRIAGSSVLVIRAGYELGLSLVTLSSLPIVYHHFLSESSNLTPTFAFATTFILLGLGLREDIAVVQEFEKLMKKSGKTQQNWNKPRDYIVLVEQAANSGYTKRFSGARPSSGTKCFSCCVFKVLESVMLRLTRLEQESTWSCDPEGHHPLKQVSRSKRLL